MFWKLEKAASIAFSKQMKSNETFQQKIDNEMKKKNAYRLQFILYLSKLNYKKKKKKNEMHNNKKKKIKEEKVRLRYSFKLKQSKTNWIQCSIAMNFAIH